MSGGGKNADFKDLVRKTLYVRKDQDVALKIMSAMEGKTEYEIVIASLDNCIPQKYFDMAQNKK